MARKKLADIASAVFQDGLILSGLGAVTYGSWLVYEPLGYIVGGCFAVGVGFLKARSSVAG